ncbi:IS110 family transposase [Paenibacillus elgii]
MKHRKERYLYVGVDLHKRTHMAVVINCWNEKLEAIPFENKPAAFPDMVEKVNLYVGEGQTVVFGLEDVGGYGRGLAVYLVEHGFLVKEVNAALSNWKRKSYAMTEKHDSWDAENIAKLLLDELDRLPTAAPQDAYWILKQLVMRRYSLRDTLVTLKNQLHTQLSYNYPSYGKFFAEVDGKTALAFWKQYPSPYLLAGVTEDTLAEFLRKVSNNVCSTRKAALILESVRADGETKRKHQEYRDFLVKSHVNQIEDVHREMNDVDDSIRDLMNQLGYKLHTIPGIDSVTASAIVAEIGDISRFSKSEKLAKYAGITPSQMSSAGRGKERNQRQGNRTLNKILWGLAVRQVQTARTSKKPLNPLFLAYYEKRLSEGKRKKQVIICIMRKLVNIIYGMMKNKTEYRFAPLPQQAAS